MGSRDDTENYDKDPCYNVLPHILLNNNIFEIPANTKLLL